MYDKTKAKFMQNRARLFSLYFSLPGVYYRRVSPTLKLPQCLNHTPVGADSAHLTGRRELSS